MQKDYLFRQDFENINDDSFQQAHWHIHYKQCKLSEILCKQGSSRITIQSEQNFVVGDCGYWSCLLFYCS